MRLLQASRLLLVAGMSMAMTCLFTQRAQAIEQGVIAQAIGATVYLEVERVYQGFEFTGSGSGFFVGPDGHLITNAHVAADHVEIEVDGQKIAVEMNVLSVKVVVNPRTQRQLVLPAQVLAVDRKRDLALLKVHHEPRHYLELRPGTEVSIADEVFVVGYPFGEMLTLDETGWVSHKGGYPEVSFNAGRVTSLRQDDEGRTVAIQTDAAINPGNSGGPMIARDGRLVGVVYADVTLSSQIGFAIPPNRLQQFITGQKIVAEFRPPYVSASRRPIPRTRWPGIF